MDVLETVLSLDLGLLVTIGVFVLVGIFGIILLVDAKRSPTSKGITVKTSAVTVDVKKDPAAYWAEHNKRLNTGS